MNRTSAGPLIALAVVGTVVGFLLQIGLAAASLPKLRVEYTFAVTIALIALVIVILAVPVYRATHGALRQPIDSFYATRVLALAKASSLTGALILGLGVGLSLDLLIRSSTTTADLVLRDLATLGSAILLLSAGLIAEFLCRVPPRDEDDDHPDRGPERVHL